VERNRQLVLKAARRVFLAKGYEGSSLEAIAEEAGFSKGVVYSQFDSKADLFLALLERRISERAEQNQRVAAESAGSASVSALVRLAMRSFLEEPEWALLVAEFRVQAARDACLNSRYAKVHARTACSGARGSSRAGRAVTCRADERDGGVRPRARVRRRDRATCQS
jgi:AcrR family transcriptional regulator